MMPTTLPYVLGCNCLVVVYELYYHVHAMKKIDVSRKTRYMKVLETERRAKRRCAHIHIDRIETFNTSVLRTYTSMIR